MKLFILIPLCLFLSFPKFAAAESIPAPAICTENQTAVWMVLKESFRDNPSLDDGSHRFLLLEGCSTATSDTTSQINGTVYLGRELDVDYPKTSPNPIAGSVVTLPFSGTETSAKYLTQGGMTQFQSADGQIGASGDFYSNRDLSYTVDGGVVEATLPASL